MHKSEKIMKEISAWSALRTQPWHLLGYSVLMNHLLRGTGRRKDLTEKYANTKKKNKYIVSADLFPCLKWKLNVFKNAVFIFKVNEKKRNCKTKWEKIILFCLLHCKIIFRKLPGRLKCIYLRKRR